MGHYFLSKSINSGKEYGEGTVVRVSAKMQQILRYCRAFHRKDNVNSNGEVLGALSKSLEKVFERNGKRNFRTQENKKQALERKWSNVKNLHYYAKA